LNRRATAPIQQIQDQGNDQEEVKEKKSSAKLMTKRKKGI
jgi:hypothetical protein